MKNLQKIIYHYKCTRYKIRNIMKELTTLHRANKTIDIDLFERTLKKIDKQGVKNVINKRDGDGETLLMKSNVVEISELLIKYGADPRIKSKSGNDALMKSILYRRYNITKLLLSIDKTLANSQNNEGLSALMVAVKYCNEEIVKLLIECGTNINATINLIDSDSLFYSNRNSNVLFYSTHTYITELLISAGVNLCQIDNDGKTILMFDKNFYNDKFYNKKLLLSTMSANPNIDLKNFINLKDNDGNSALTIAIRSKDTALCKLFIGYGSVLDEEDYKQIDNRKMLTYVNYLMKKENLSIQYTQNKITIETLTSIVKDINIELLEQTLKKMDKKVLKNIINKRNRHGETLLMKSKTIEISELLINYGADIYIKSETGYNALMISILRRRYPITKLLLSIDKNLAKSQGNGGLSAFMFVAEQGNKEIVDLFIECGADINATTSLNRNVLSNSGYPHITKILIDKGVNLYQINCYGFTILMEQNSVENLRLLLQTMVSNQYVDLKKFINLKDKRGTSTLMHKITENVTYDHIKILIDYGALLDQEELEELEKYNKDMYYSCVLKYIKYLMNKKIKEILEKSSFDAKIIENIVDFI